ncbi:MAG: hypothetical protein K1X72_09810 [Pyrinomonadaceae bacterium]|nr:hypothetical protein [Pyrinomonadaceae bacterium]
MGTIKTIQVKSSGTSVMDSTNRIEGESQPRLSSVKQTIDENILLEFDDKISRTTTSFSANKNPIENFTKIEGVLNGDKFSFKTDLISDGKRIDMNAIFNSPFMSESMKKQMKEAQEKAKPTKESFQKSVLTELFPILLNMNWMKDKKFIYIGKAEAGEKRADILEIETDTGRQTRYFFDEKTHLLLMITDEISKDEKSSKTTTYFDDYQLFDGLLVAKKVNREIESSLENMELEVMGKKRKMSSKSKMVSETLIKEFNINPTFKPDAFTVKESQ